MRLLPLAAVALGVAVLGLATPLAAAQTGAEGAARTHPFFPDHGTLNALVLFVQHRDDAFEDCHDRTRVVEEDGRMFHPQIDDAVCHSGPDVPEATSWTDDEATEWPVYWSTGEAGPRLPQYAADGWLAPPGTPPSGYAEGSLSQYYHLNSGGRFELHGYVYPEVYIPQHDRATYRDHPQPFANGGLRLSHEILSSPGIQAFVEAIPDAHLVFDRYRNGTNLTLEDLGDDARDGLFDLIVMVFRSNRPCRVGTYVGRGGRCLQPTASGSSSLGSDKVYLVANGFAPSPLFLGGLEVVDNFRTGSGVWSAGGDARTAVTLTAHEIGHRQLYYQHSDENS
ncbi:MAG: hypothetical protein R3181_09310, partial [Rubricoccaceae bacterium]|nr:hypothetical protein [Rubricoccaceae bacterium]